MADVYSGLAFTLSRAFTLSVGTSLQMSDLMKTLLVLKKLTSALLPFLQFSSNAHDIPFCAILVKYVVCVYIYTHTYTVLSVNEYTPFEK